MFSKKTVLKKVSEQVPCCLKLNRIYVSQNSAQTFESNVFKNIFVELKAVMFFVAFKVWITSYL